jgi:hypothetical protein
VAASSCPSNGTRASRFAASAELTLTGGLRVRMSWRGSTPSISIGERGNVSRAFRRLRRGRLSTAQMAASINGSR